MSEGPVTCYVHGVCQWSGFQWYRDEGGNVQWDLDEFFADLDEFLEEAAKHE